MRRGKQHRRADELAESEERSRLLLAGLPDTIVGLLDRDLRCVSVDGLGLAGLDPADFIGRRPEEYMDPARAERLIPLYEAALRGERSSLVYGVGLANRHFDMDIAPFRRGGEIEGVFVVTRDVTARELARADAVAASDAKSAFLANMSHEIRTPLNGVIGMLDLLAETPLSDLQRDYASTAAASAEALLAVVNQILDFSSIEAGTIELDAHEFGLRELVESTAGMLAPTAQAKSIELATAVDADVPEVVRGDSARLRQVLTNLLANAVKFTAHGRVDVRVRMVRGDVRFEVADTGIGIDPAELPELFAPFTQADVSTTREYGGTGLGLAIARQLVELMGGTIGAESQLGAGSTFAFTLTFD
jgi:two-component system sensor histidine kinase/response regulator